MEVLCYETRIGVAIKNLDFGWDYFEYRPVILCLTKWKWVLVPWVSGRAVIQITLQGEN